MTDFPDEDTTQIDRELIAEELERTAKLAVRLKETELGDEILALAAKIRKTEEGEKA